MAVGLGLIRKVFHMTRKKRRKIISIIWVNNRPNGLPQCLTTKEIIKFNMNILQIFMKIIGTSTAIIEAILKVAMEALISIMSQVTCKE